MTLARTDHRTSAPAWFRRAGSVVLVVAALAAVALGVGAIPTPQAGHGAALTAAEHAVLVPAGTDRRHDQAGLALATGLVAVGAAASVWIVLGIAGPGARHRDRRARWRAWLEGAPPALL